VDIVTSITPYPKIYRPVILWMFIFIGLLVIQSCTKKTTLPDPLESGWNGKAVCEVLEDSPQLRVLKCTFPPGVGHERHFHKPHWGYAISGSKFRMTDTTGTREIEISSGSSFRKEAILWHEALNIGDSTAVFLIIEPK